MTKGFPSLGGLGKAIGSELGGGFGKMLGGKRGESAGRSIGGELGKIGGEVAPLALAFKNGGRVPGKLHKPVKAVVHSGEYILPVGVKPTKAQVKAVAAKKAKDAKKK